MEAESYNQTHMATKSRKRHAPITDTDSDESLTASQSQSKSSVPKKPYDHSFRSGRKGYFSSFSFSDTQDNNEYYPGIQFRLPCTPPRTIFHGCQIVHWDPLDGKRRCPQKNFGLGYVKLHGFYANP